MDALDGHRNDKGTVSGKTGTGSNNGTSNTSNGVSGTR